MPKDTATPQSEIRDTEEAVETAESHPDLTDDQIWDQIGREDQQPEEAEVIDATPEEPDPAEDVEEESETFETEVLSEEETINEDQEEADRKGKQHNYEKRYKDLEKEFHKRNEETKELREQFQQLRLERLEMEREVERLRKGEPPQDTQKTPPKEASPLDEDWLDSDTRQTLEDFSELTAAYKKLIAQEIAKATSGVTQQSQEKIEELEKIAQTYQQQQYWQRHASELIRAVGTDFMEIDVSPEFSKYVYASPMRTKMMNGTSWEDHIAVMQDFLETPVGKAKFRPDVEASPPSSQEKTPESKQASNTGTVRRQAAQGLLKNSSPRQERRPEDMSDDELWDSIAS